MMGPVISARQLGIVEELVESARKDGANVVCGGERLKGISTLDGHDLSKGYVPLVFDARSSY
jgi:acyl-CoA reductase-like NAD-dependent aldehyde dehydrogenase